LGYASWREVFGLRRFIGAFSGGVDLRAGQDTPQRIPTRKMKAQ
jgi:hypothetical protein